MVPEPEEPGLWKDFLRSCKSSAQDMQKEQAVWKTWESVVPFLRGEAFVAGDEDKFKDAINEFTKSFVECWGEGHVTHYMHILYAHGPWLIREHGSLGVWQCQGMEKSHWRARGNWQKHTNHDGGRGDRSDIKACSLFQLLRYDFRMLQHRRRETALRGVKERVKLEKEKRKSAAAAVWKRWYEAAEQTSKDLVAANAEKARAVRKRNIRAVALAKWEAKKDLMKSHGVVLTSYEASLSEPSVY